MMAELRGQREHDRNVSAMGPSGTRAHPSRVRRGALHVVPQAAGQPPPLICRAR
jgi:hypothetical protein